MTEYEYLLSGKLRGVIEKWQSRLFGSTRVARDIFHVRILRLAKLISVPKGSPLDKYDRLYGGLFDGEKCPTKLKGEATRQFRELSSAHTTAQAIRAILETYPDASGTEELERGYDKYSAQKWLKDELPPEVKGAHADWIALFFDGFPKPWLQVEREEDSAYFGPASFVRTRKEGFNNPSNMNTTDTTKITTRRTRRRYGEEFKRDAVALLEAGQGATQLARELCVSQWNLRDWKERYGAGRAGVSQGARSAPQANAGAASPVALAVELAGCAANSPPPSASGTF